MHQLVAVCFNVEKAIHYSLVIQYPKDLPQAESVKWIATVNIEHSP
jgi:hypothetical protein